MEQGTDKLTWQGLVGILILLAALGLPVAMRVHYLGWFLGLGVTLLDWTGGLFVWRLFI